MNYCNIVGLMSGTLKCPLLSASLLSIDIDQCVHCLLTSACLAFFCLYSGPSGFDV